MRIERVGLEHHGHVPVAGRHLVDNLVVDLDLARRDVLQARQHAQRGRLAAAGRPNQDHELGVFDVEREVVDRDGIGAKSLGDLLEGNGRHTPKS